MKDSFCPDPEHEIVVLGGGPAGVVTAIGLVRLGIRVALVSAPRKFAALEGISERACRGLEFAGCARALAQIGPEVPRVAYWNGTRSDYNSERIVVRNTFDAALLDDARDAGVEVIHGRARSARWSDEKWRVRLRDGRGERSLYGGFLIDARGRAADRARTRWVSGPPTMSLGRRWRFREAGRPETGVTAWDWGWMWHAVQPDGSGSVQVFLSSAVGPLPPRPELPAYYERLLRSNTALGDRLAAAEALGGVHARDAGMGLSPDAVTDRSARVGDAALAMDPLAGHGIFEAVGGALALVPVVNTILRRPTAAALARRFYRDKLNDDFERMARVGRDFYREERRWPDSPFWRERRRWPDDQPAHRPGAAHPARVARRAVSDGGVIRNREVIVTGDHPRGVWRVAGVPLVALLRWVERTPGDDTVRTAAERFGASAEAAGTALAWLRARGLLPGDIEVPMHPPTELHR